MARGFINSVKFEWQLAVKEKMIFIVIFLIPLLTNIMLGYELSGNQLKNIPMAVCDLDNSSLSRMIVQEFSDNETFKVKYFLNTPGDMEKLFNENRVRVGMVIPPDFHKDVVEMKSPTILMIYDGSHMPMASAAKTRASEILMTLKTGMLIKLIEAKLNVPQETAEKMALAVGFSNRTLYNPTRGYKNFLNIGLGAAIVQSGIALMASTAFRKNEVKGHPAEIPGHIAGKITFYGLAGFLSLMMTVMLQKEVFSIPFRGNFTGAVLLSLLFSFSVASCGLLISVLVKNEMLSTLAAAVLFVPDTILVGYTWPVIAMPDIYQRLARYIPFYHYADNLRDMFLKGTNLSYMGRDMAWLEWAIAVTTLFSVLIGMARIKMEVSAQTGGGGENAAL
ncbi:ABC transporter permease [Thermoanaerobacterium sp. DL9XJH110]|uniref:ABC transporter permease n=1 Tax=Thermoanaerobacterium sp. DL9XJH110 TaxID=3386643 RepID=UPI003BB568D4